MGVMFVPNDDAMYHYFTEGGGKTLMDRYNPNVTITRQNFKEMLAQIPLNIIKFFVNNLMKESFNESVPSKYLTIMNDAADAMFEKKDYPEVSNYEALMDSVALANNGVVYIMNTVFGPATYSSVSGPVLFSTESRVVNTVLHADDIAVNSTNTSAAPLRKFYSTYLLAMQSHFSFFVPTDKGLREHGYVDPVAYSKGAASQRLFWTLEYQPITQSGSQQIAITGKTYTYKEAEDFAPSGNPKKTHAANQSMSANEGLTKKTILTDMIDQHIVVHETEGELLSSGRRYFLSRNGAPVYIRKRGTNNGEGMLVDGGFQVDLRADAYDNDYDCKVEKVYDQTRDGYGNGVTYFLSRPMQPTMKTTYNLMKAETNASTFFKLCEDASSKGDLLSTIFRRSIKDETKENPLAEDNLTLMDESDWNSELKRYQIFDGTRITARGEKLVRFFNSYRYTVYLPSNDAMQVAIDNENLPTWESIEEFVNANTNSEKIFNSVEAWNKAKAMVTCLVNFLKYHFQDNSLFVDNVTSSEEYQTACRNNATNAFLRINVAQNNGEIVISDAAGTKHYVRGAEGNNKFARDYEYDANTQSASYGIKNSSYVVLHNIQGNDVMVYDNKLKGDFSNAWKNPAEAKRFVKKYRLTY